MNKQNQLNIFYDEEADVLYLTKGHPDYTDYVEYRDNLILRFDPETNELIGFTIMDFSMYFTKKDEDIHLPINAKFEVSKIALSLRQ